MSSVSGQLGLVVGWCVGYLGVFLLVIMLVGIVRYRKGMRVDNTEIFREEVSKIIDEYIDDGLLSDRSIQKILQEILEELKNE